MFNVHNLIHIADDVENFKCSLNEVSAFPFENSLQLLKHMVRGGKNPIAQVCKRIREGEAVGGRVCKTTRQKFISAGGRDSMFLLSNNLVAEVTEKLEDGTIACNVYNACSTESFFTVPCDSKQFDICFIRKECRFKRKILSRSSFERKVVCLPYGDGRVAFPLLHPCERCKFFSIELAVNRLYCVFTVSQYIYAGPPRGGTGGQISRGLAACRGARGYRDINNTQEVLLWNTEKRLKKEKKVITYISEMLLGVRLFDCTGTWNFVDKQKRSHIYLNWQGPRLTFAPGPGIPLGGPVYMAVGRSQFFKFFCVGHSNCLFCMIACLI